MATEITDTLGYRVVNSLDKYALEPVFHIDGPAILAPLSVVPAHNPALISDLFGATG